MRFFFNDTATTEIYTLSLHDALPILLGTDSLTLVPGPVSGNASVSQVVKGSDTRLSDARTPTAHQTTHRRGGSAPLVSASCDAAATDLVLVSDSKLTTAPTPTPHLTPHQHTVTHPLHVTP